MGKTTLDIAPSGCYPVAGIIANDSVVQLYSVPVVFKYPNTRYDVTRSFILRSLPTPGQPVWSVPAPMAMTDSTVRVYDVQILKGEYVLTATYGSYVRTVPIYLNYDVNGGVDSPDDAEADLQILPGVVVLPAGPYAVFTLSGQMVASGEASSGYMLRLPVGVYVVRTAKRSAKVLIH